MSILFLYHTSFTPLSYLIYSYMYILIHIRDIYHAYQVSLYTPSHVIASILLLYLLILYSHITLILYLKISYLYIYLIVFDYYHAVLLILLTIYFIIYAYFMLIFHILYSYNMCL